MAKSPSTRIIFFSVGGALGLADGLTDGEALGEALAEGD